MDELRKSWEARAQAHPGSLSGVLFRGLSEHANGLIGRWHEWLVRELFLPRMPQAACVLDLGCGYGRISQVIAAQRADVNIVGQDFAWSYCHQFATTFGNCVNADAAALPFREAVFDGIVAVTCLMYLEGIQLQSALQTLNGLLRPGGVLLAVDPGEELKRLIAAIRGRRAQSATGGSGFRCDEYLELFRRAGFDIVARGGNPRLSLALLIPGATHATGGTSMAWLDRCARGDNARRGYSRLALHRWVLARRKPA